MYFQHIFINLYEIDPWETLIFALRRSFNMDRKFLETDRIYPRIIIVLLSFNFIPLIKSKLYKENGC